MTWTRFSARTGFLAAEAGVQQFLDIGTGIPAANNTHEVTQAVRPEARVTCVDNDRCKSSCAHILDYRVFLALRSKVVTGTTRASAVSPRARRPHPQMPDEIVVWRAVTVLARDCATVPNVNPIRDESPRVTLDDDALNALLDLPFTQLTVDELMAIKDAYAARGIRIYNSASIEQMILAFLAGNLGAPFLQALSQRAANSIADMSRQVTDAVRKHVKRKGHSDDTPRIELPNNMTDEAWLALFEIVEANELRGKVLRWDAKAMIWRPDSMDG
jgi:hypothetical protein